MRESIKILIVSSGTSGKANAFVLEQSNSLADLGNEIEHLLIRSKGINGYLKSLPILKNNIETFKPDIIHAHYGLSGLLAVLQKKIPVVITFHNGEILSPFVNLLSSLAAMFCNYRIYVAQHIKNKMYFRPKKDFLILPCGIDLDQSIVIEKNKATKCLNLNSNKINILFGGAFSNKRKNYKLALEAIALIDLPKDINLIELKNYNREEVTKLLNACDIALLTSKSEGSPQFIKEAMACNCPIVSTDVGDIKYLIGNTEGCYLTTSEPQDIANKIKLAINFGKRTNGRKNILDFDNKIIAGKIIEVYKRVLNNNE